MSLLPAEAESIKTLTRIAGIIALIIGVIYIIAGAIFLFLAFIGFIVMIPAVLNIWIYMKCNEIIKHIEEKRYREAKEETLWPMILGFILSWIIVGILLLVAYMKYDELLRKRIPPPPPP